MNFELKLWSPIETKREYDENGKRWYVAGDKKYPSVTTALSVLSERGIAEWRKRIGEEEANKITTQASRAGSALHYVAERYMLQEKSWKLEADPISLAKFLTIKPYIDNCIDEVYGIELQMISHKYMVGGTADCICRYNGMNTILDFKTSRKEKTDDMIMGYFLQAATYGQMCREIYNWEPEQIVILMAVNDGTSQVFVKNIVPYEKLAEKFYKFYHNNIL